MILNYICHAEFWSEYDRIRTIFQLIFSYLLWTLGEKLTFKSDAHNIRSAKDKATQPEINTLGSGIYLYIVPDSYTLPSLKILKRKGILTLC